MQSLDTRHWTMEKVGEGGSGHFAIEKNGEIIFFIFHNELI